jgi:DNA-binding MarR family transcriptional regulator
MRMCELAESVILSPSGLSRRVERLERRGLVQRERSTQDARSVEASITDEGRRLFRRLRRLHRDGISRYFSSRFSERELETLGPLLARLTSND